MIYGTPKVVITSDQEKQIGQSDNKLDAPSKTVRKQRNKRKKEEKQQILPGTLLFYAF